MEQKNIKHQLKLFKRLTRLKSMCIVFCLIFYMLVMCIYFFFQVAVTVTCKCDVVKTPTHTKRNQTSCIRNMRCTCAKNNIVCTAKCRCVNCGNGKLSVQSVKRRKREPPLLTTSLSSQTSLEYLLNSGEERERPWITSFQHFILESMLCITLKDLNGKLCEFDIGFLKKQLHECYQKLLEELREKNLLDNQEHERVDWTTLEKWLKARTKKKIFMNQLLSIE